jgi:WD40 repeat protein
LNEQRSNIVQKRWFWLMTLLLLAVIPLAAQDETPAAVREAALDAGEAALGIRAENWRFQALNPTKNSVLGCPLVTGEEMPVEVTPYRVELIYPNGVYVVLVSADGRIAQLCDDKFGDAMVNPAEATPDPNACKVTPTVAIPAYAAPDNTVPGIFTTAAGTAYEPFGISSDGEWYQVANDVGLGWVDAKQVTVSGACSELSINAFTAPDDTGAVCFVTTLGAFSNVRTQPSTDGAQVGQIFENVQFQATARNTPNDWYFIQPGWVAGRVTTQIGDCAGLTVNDSLVGTGFTADLPGDLDETVARALAESPCTADFEGYLRPRLVAGFANAQVVTSGTPNALRTYPVTDDAVGQRLGVIQPGRTIDRVISGPVCNQGFVWWLVEFDGTTGWTAESNDATDEYFIEPLGNVQPVPAATTAFTTPVANNADAIAVNDKPITALIFNSDGSRLFAAAQEQGFGDALNGFVSVWNLETNTSEGRIDVPSGVAALDYALEADLLLVAANNGTVTFYSASDPNLAATVAYEDVFAADMPVVPQLVIAPDGTSFAVLECETAECTASQLRILSVEDASEEFSNVFDVVVDALAISPDGAQIAAAGNNGVSFFNVAEAEAGNFYSVGDDTSLPMYDIAFNADGSQLLFVGCKILSSDACTRGRIDLLNVENATLLGSAESHNSAATLVAYNLDSTRFATVNESDEIILRNATTGTDIVTYNAGATVTSIAFTADGSRIAVGMETGQILFFDATVAE